jgi:hypothetical protein
MSAQRQAAREVRELRGEEVCTRRVAVRDDERASPEILGVSPRKTVNQGRRDRARGVLPPLHQVDECANLRTIRVIYADDASVPNRSARPYLATMRAQEDSYEVIGSVVKIGMRILLVSDQDVGSPHHVTRQVTVRVQ